MINLLLAAVVIGVVGFGVALALRSRREFAEQNQVVPGTPSSAPASWAGAHSREAKLHRRLGAAVRSARAHPRVEELGLASQLAAIDAQAISLDDQLVAGAALTEPHRTAAIDRVEEQTAALETTIGELVAGLEESAPRSQLDAAIANADERLTALAAARDEVEELDRLVSGQTEVPDLHTEVAPDGEPDGDTNGESDGEPGTTAQP
ncbi:MAG: hypothetical protein AAGD33_00440 [Actinomycetota bacterium]